VLLNILGASIYSSFQSNIRFGRFSERVIWADVTLESGRACLFDDEKGEKSIRKRIRLSSAAALRGGMVILVKLPKYKILSDISLRV
jgi:hypothetical protein